MLDTPVENEDGLSDDAVIITDVRYPENGSASPVVENFGTVLDVDDPDQDEKPIELTAQTVRNRSHSPVKKMSRKDAKKYISELEAIKNDVERKIRAATAEYMPEKESESHKDRDQKKKKKDSHQKKNKKKNAHKT